ncbi:hypothetical protein HDV02_003180 [Globomyces sp. JEL0801]|nr:hypothetical protein HDV02_003180 [Globomyces sp. JEL0801]
MKSNTFDQTEFSLKFNYLLFKVSSGLGHYTVKELLMLLGRIHHPTQTCRNPTSGTRKRRSKSSGKEMDRQKLLETAKLSFNSQYPYQQSITNLSHHSNTGSPKSGTNPSTSFQQKFDRFVQRYRPRHPSCNTSSSINQKGSIYCYPNKATDLTPTNQLSPIDQLWLQYFKLK